MSRVNSKLVKQRLNEKRSKITDRQFFTSRLLAGHFEDIAAAQTRRYNYQRRVHVKLEWKPKDKFIASTDNFHIRINTGNPLVTKIRGRENRYVIVCGIYAHELGHVLYTDFLVEQTHLNFFERFLWFPEPPVLKTSADMRNEKALWEYVKLDPNNSRVVQLIMHNISNILEDGYVENRMLNNFPGTLGYGLESLRTNQFQQLPSVTQLKEKEEDKGRHIFESIMQVMLSYAKFGELKYGDEPLSDERIQTVFGLITEIDRALITRSAKERLSVVNLIIVRCWEHIKDFCELCKQMQDEAEAAGKSTEIAETVSEILKSITGSSAMGTGSSTAVSESSSEETESSATAAKRAKTKAEANGSGEDESTDSGGAKAEEDKPQEEDGAESAEISASDAMDGEDSGCSSGKQKVSETEEGRIPLRQTESVSEPVGGSVEVNAAYEREKYAHAAEDIERIMDKMAEKAACKQLENERLRELNDAAQSISYGNIHAGVNIRVNRVTEVDDELVEQFNAISPPLLNISRQLQKTLTRQLKENNRGGKQTGLLMGRRLDAHAVHRQDGKLFCKNALPNETPQLAVGLLLDESGSMSSCDRCTYARASAIILHDFCQGLHIPVMVYGHSSDSNVQLFSYAEFDSFDHDDKYRLMDIGARGSNRDGAALRFVADQLAKRPEVVKMLIIVSDGQPSDYGYYGTAAEEDLRGIKQEYQRKGILFVAAAIGDDKQNIERIYGDSFMDITDLNQLPTKLTTVVKRHIRV